MGEFDQRHRLSFALYSIHRRGTYLCGLSELGEQVLEAGGAIGGDCEVSLEQGMNSYTQCSRCGHDSRPGEKPRDHWPCETVVLLLEAGVIEPWDESMGSDKATRIVHRGWAPYTAGDDGLGRTVITR